MEEEVFDEMVDHRFWYPRSGTGDPIAYGI